MMRFEIIDAVHTDIASHKHEGNVVLALDC